MHAFRLLVILLLFMSPAHALTIDYEVSPEIVLPGGYADCVVKISNTGTSSVEINSISFISETIQFEPSYIQHVGNLSAGGVYTLKVSMKSSALGRQTAQMVVSTSEGSFSQNIELVVDDRFPEISLASPLYRGEANYVNISVSSPILLRDFRIEALFNASPKVFFAGELYGVRYFQLRLGEDLNSLNFKISFYNGRSYHEIEKAIRVDYLPSKGVVVSLQSSKDLLFIGEAVNLTLEIANLRSDDIYSLEIQLFGNGKFSQNSLKIDRIASGDKKILNFIFGPRESGKAEIFAKIKYEDFFGREFEKEEKITFNVLDSYVLQVINIQKTPTVGKTKISGEVVNYGDRSVLNTKVSVSCDEESSDYYIGEIDAKDYETFDLETSCKKATLFLNWWNEAGDSFSLSEELELGNLGQTESNPVPLYIVGGASVSIISFILYLVYRARKK